MKEKIDTQHPTYAALQSKRDLFRAVKGGTDAIQAGGKTYLPMYPAESKEDYDARLRTATIDGIVAGGVDTLSGAVFYGDIDVSKVNPSIQPLLENIDLKGNHFNVFARQSFEAGFDGYAVILVDSPEETEIVAETKRIYGDEANKIHNIRPYWRLYEASSVINHRYRVNEATQATELELIVFHEPKEVVDPTDRFKVNTIDQYRVFYLQGSSVVWELWEKVKEKTALEAEFKLIKGPAVLDGRSAIPVAIMGCLTDEPKLLVESRLEVRAYQKESSFDAIEYLSVPILTIIGRDGADKGQNIPYGPATFIDVPLGGDAKYVAIDAGGHESLKGTIQNIKEYIKARLNELTSAAMQSTEKTATQVAVEDKDKQARLIVWAEQAKDAWELALSYTAEAMGLGFDKGGEITLMTKWEAARQESEARKQMEVDAQAAAITKTQAEAKATLAK